MGIHANESFSSAEGSAGGGGGGDATSDFFFFYFLETKAISFKIPVLQQVLVKRVTEMCEVLDSMTEVKVTSTPNEDWTGCEP